MHVLNACTDITHPSPLTRSSYIALYISNDSLTCSLRLHSCCFIVMQVVLLTLNFTSTQHFLWKDVQQEVPEEGFGLLFLPP